MSPEQARILSSMTGAMRADRLAEKSKQSIHNGVVCDFTGIL